MDAARESSGTGHRLDKPERVVRDPDDRQPDGAASGVGPNLKRVSNWYPPTPLKLITQAYAVAVARALKRGSDRMTVDCPSDFENDELERELTIAASARGRLRFDRFAVLLAEGQRRHLYPTPRTKSSISTAEWQVPPWPRAGRLS